MNSGKLVECVRGTVKLDLLNPAILVKLHLLDEMSLAAFLRLRVIETHAFLEDRIPDLVSARLAIDFIQEVVLIARCNVGESGQDLIRSHRRFFQLRLDRRVDDRMLEKT